ncbi:hypothetical protein B0A50_02037 [Salinomyces thailandicus]|uniref:Uncharacterized protein n=1 Tax=Salinomyces thailandicus TaxID=706561 RepID=A0A4V6WJW0_9PEZI|nr:hypothetical protein B0A50_02037 [Salinomyces thailandica]
MDFYTEHLISGIATAQAANPADIKSKTGAKRKRASHAPDIPWTASRCTRLLRTITSRIAILQKLAANSRLSREAAGNRKTRSEHDHERVKGPAGALATPATPSKDPEWLPAVNQPPTTRTYGGRARAAKQPSRSMSRPKNDSLSMATPFVKRMLKPGSGTPISAEEGFQDKDVKTKRRQQLPIKPSSSAEEAYRSLEAALGSFLHATRPPVESAAAQPRTGSRSLMSSCLRRVPEYVALEEACLEANEGSGSDDQEQDVSREIYEELERYGASESGGWHGLREVVRADGLHRIEAAIEAGSMSMDVVETLVKKCREANAVGESQRLLTASMRVGSRRVVAGTAESLDQLYSLGDSQSADAYVLRTLSTFLESNARVLDNNVVRTWAFQIFFRAVLREGERAEAEFFLQTLLRVASTGSGEILEETLRSVVVLLGAAVEGQRSEGGKMARRGNALVELLDRTVCHSLLSAGENEDLRSLRPFVLVSFITRLSSKPDQSLKTVAVQTEDLLALLDSTRNSDWTPSNESLVSGVALCIGRWDGQAADAFLVRTVDSLLQMATPSTCSVGTSSMLRALALSSVSAYAEQRQDKEILMYAEEVEDLVAEGAGRMQEVGVRTPVARKPKREMFRWEEGLCEWIAKTPFGAVAKVKMELGKGEGPEREVKRGVGKAQLPTPPPISEERDPAHLVFDRSSKLTTKRPPNATTNGVVRSPVERDEKPSTFRPEEKENAIPEAEEDLSSECDELAMSAVKKPRSAYNPPKPSRASLTRPSHRASSGSVTTAWEASAAEVASDDELGL